MSTCEQNEAISKVLYMNRYNYKTFSILQLGFVRLSADHAALCLATALKALIPHKHAGAKFARERLRFVRGETIDMEAATFRTYEISPPGDFYDGFIEGGGILKGAISYRDTGVAGTYARNQRANVALGPQDHGWMGWTIDHANVMNLYHRMFVN